MKNSTRIYPGVRHYSPLIMSLFAEVARMHAAFQQQALPVEAYENSMARADQVRRQVEGRLAAARDTAASA